LHSTKFVTGVKQDQESSFETQERSRSRKIKLRTLLSTAPDWTTFIDSCLLL